MPPRDPPGGPDPPAHFDLDLDRLRHGLRAAQYLTTDRAETAAFLALTLGRPLLAEGPAGAGKTELAKALASALDTDLIRLQCYEGLDEAKALYEWDHARQLLKLQVVRAGQEWESLAKEIYSRAFLLERPLLRALSAPSRVVLLIDEVDKADEEFEAFLLEFLSEFQVTIPEFGTVRATVTPVVVLTSNRARELSEALRRRCLHLWLDFPTEAQERDIVALKAPELDAALRDEVVRFVHALRRLELDKAPSIAETLDFARGLLALGVSGLDVGSVRRLLGLLVKTRRDEETVAPRLATLLPPSRRR